MLGCYLGLQLGDRELLGPREQTVSITRDSLFLFGGYTTFSVQIHLVWSIKISPIEVMGAQ